MLIAVFRSLAMFSGPCPVRIFEASSANAVSLTKWTRFSITHCDLASCPIRCGDAWRAVKSLIT
ncbi:hypothetical protein [Streptomyces sp. NPDC013457]|uniref:hypothetical protein n=1 Tax=Streptomyces sp. NPDC013457 TaxID=3364866 RepID=UPI0036FBD3AF